VRLHARLLTYSRPVSSCALCPHRSVPPSLPQEGAAAPKTDPLKWIPPKNGVRLQVALMCVHANAWWSMHLHTLLLDTSKAQLAYVSDLCRHHRHMHGNHRRTPAHAAPRRRVSIAQSAYIYIVHICVCVCVRTHAHVVIVRYMHAYVHALCAPHAAVCRTGVLGAALCPTRVLETALCSAFFNKDGHETLDATAGRGLQLCTAEHAHGQTG
jgi:hypothetical protein